MQGHVLAVLHELGECELGWGSRSGGGH